MRATLRIVARSLALALLGLAMLAAAIELLCRLLPVSSATMRGYPLDPDLLTYPPHHRFTVSTGWDLRNPQHLQANNWGFVAAHDFAPDPRAVALVGDSFVEASMLDAADRPGAQLERLLRGARPVYAMGSPGTALLDHAERMRVAAERFGVRDFVLLLEGADARQSLCGSGNVQSRCLDPRTLEPWLEREAPPGTLKRLARHSAAVGYFYGQLKFDARRIVASVLRHRGVPAEPGGAVPAEPAGPAAEQPPSPRSRAVVDAVTARFFERVRPYAAGRLVMLVDGGRGDGEPADLATERRYLIAALRERGATVVDLEPVFRAQRARSPLALRVGPYDGHLNRLGVELAMTAAAAGLQAP